MNDYEQIKVEQEARGRVGDPRQSTGYSQAIQRYLGVFSYAERKPPVREPAPEPVRS